MSVNKKKLKHLVARTCPEHGYGCTKGCSFIRNGYQDSRPIPTKKKKR